MRYFQKNDSGNSLIFPNYLDVSALGWGLLLGEDDDFSRELNQVTRKAGISHLTAASGSNISLVQTLAGFSRGYFWPFLSLKIALIFAYLWLAGSSGSLLRASWQACYLSISGLLGRPISALWSLLGVMLMGYVWGWAESLGFWLSWLAVVGIYLSQLVQSGEALWALFPQRMRIYSFVSSQLLVGSVVLSLVSVVIFFRFGEWQPQGLLSTLFSQPFTTPYLSLFLVSFLFEEGNKVALKNGWSVAALFEQSSAIGFSILWLLFMLLFYAWLWLGELPTLVPSALVMYGLLEFACRLFRGVQDWRRQRLEKHQWGWE